MDDPKPSLFVECVQTQNHFESEASTASVYALAQEYVQALYTYSRDDDMMMKMMMSMHIQHHIFRV